MNQRKKPCWRNTGTPPLKQLSYSEVFYLTGFFKPHNSVILLSNKVFPWPKVKKTRKKKFNIFFCIFLPDYFLILLPIIFSQAFLLSKMLMNFPLGWTWSEPNHDKVLTQWRHMPLGQFCANNFLIRITSTYFLASESLKNQSFKSQLIWSFPKKYLKLKSWLNFNAITVFY